MQSREIEDKDEAAGIEGGAKKVKIKRIDDKNRKKIKEKSKTRTKRWVSPAESVLQC